MQVIQSGMSLSLWFPYMGCPISLTPPITI